MAKSISIMGDSISTYEGYNPLGFRVYYYDERCELNGLASVSDTWWMQVVGALSGELCVNGSYSGSWVTGPIFPAATSEKRIANLRTAEREPDAILIYLGINDYLNNVEVGDDAATGTQCESSRYFAEAYDCLLRKLKAAYSRTDIICGTLMRTEMRGYEYWVFPERNANASLDEYNDAIRRAAARNGCLLADLNGLGLRYETLDGTHPTAQGHATIAQAWVECCKELL